MNGQYEGDDPIGILMHDFNCKDPDEMRDDLMRERAKCLKESEKGVREVSISGLSLDEVEKLAK